MAVGDLVGTIEHDYPEFHVRMHCFACMVAEGQLELKEHEAAKWLDADHLEDVAWLASDLDLLPAIRKILLSPKL